MAEQDSPKKKREKTIDLSEWQKKNQAYLEQRAKEKAEKEKEEAEVSKKEDVEEADQESEDLTAKDEVDSDDEESTQSKTSESGEADDEGQESDDNSDEEVEEKTDDSKDDKQDLEEGENSSDDESDSEDSQVMDLEQAATEKKLRLAQQRELALKATPVFLLAFIMILIGAYFISPWSRSKRISVSGNEQVAKADILAASGILAEDYTVTAILQQGAYAKSISKALPLVKSAQVSYQFPVDFKIKVEEYYTIAYVKDGQTYHSVLSSGAVLADQIAEENIPPSALVIQMTDLAMVKKLVLALDLLDNDLVAKMQRIELSATPASKDLLRISTVEGHDLLVPLGEVGKKLPYYAKILPKLTVPSVIDMEVGLYSYPK